MLLCAVACSDGFDGEAMIPGGIDGFFPSASKGEAADGSISDDIGEGTDEGNGDYTSGLLTAAAWDDNEYFEMYKDLFKAGTEADEQGGTEAVPAGKFFAFLQNHWNFYAHNRVKVSVTHGGLPVAGATVVFENESGAKEFSAVSGSDGVAYLFTAAESGTVRVTSGETELEVAFTEEEREIEVSLDGEVAPKENKIQIMFVIDITGSMGDEHSYLKNELRNVIERISEKNEGAEIQVALLFYRDDGDNEKFAYYDFANATDEQSLNNIIKNLSKHHASGGGDYEEAVDEALALAVSKDWADDSTTKLIFHLLDAPAHSTDKNKQLFSSAVMTACNRGIKICPILASGADTVCEYTMRQAALYTGGMFIFITDHSGIGNSHLDPNIPNIVVEKLNDLLVRVITGYHKGEFEAPVPYNQSTAE